MNALLSELDPAIIAGLFGAAMLAGWAVGWCGTRPMNKEDEPEGPNKLNDAMMSMLGLLLAFTFSMSLVKHEQRRQASVTDSNAIGDFYTCAGLLPEPVRSELQGVVRRYVERRLELARSRPTEAELDAALAGFQELHGRMQALVQRAVAGGTPIVVPLVNTLNGVTSSHAARLSAVRDRLPPSIVWLLFTTAVLAMGATGRRHGLANKWRPGTTLGFTIIVAAVVWVTLDLNQPQQGAITISQEPLERLLDEMRVAAPAGESAPGAPQTVSPSTPGLSLP